MVVDAGGGAGLELPPPSSVCAERRGAKGGTQRHVILLGPGRHVLPVRAPEVRVRPDDHKERRKVLDAGRGVRLVAER